ncbi:hypothetical protein DS745_02820 [Anaerobacillus alkaliphilus]|uniref:Uncharacterized protein n=1 Tax=Anaerobacillus alkaliphilus TaxID=1548597 RepID=A0A4Q0VXD2_9BACI|nr:hypothetical protein [Anaerobacillus alkaliphilus]RXJ04334.1 hypothetical protein DS745_02820 [Anaerobacillus alkaliphilus]
MKRLAIILFILIIGSIIISSFFFIGKDTVKEETKLFIREIILLNESQLLTSEENEEIKLFFESLEALNLPHPIIEGIEIPYYDVFTPPTENEEFLQYISVKYDQVTATVSDTDIHFEYILYNEVSKNPEEIYFGKLTLRSSDTDVNLVAVHLMERQK